MDSHRLPVLIASGFFPVPLPLESVRTFYEKRGHATEIVPFAFDNMRDVVRYAKAVALSAAEFSGRHGGKINLFGFSMGGVASLYAIKRLGIADRVAVLLACCSPFHGVPLAYVGIPTRLFTKVGWQLSPKSKFLRQLRSDPLPSGPRYVAVAGTHDMICPAESARFEGAELISAPYSHNDFIVNDRLHALIDGYLA